MRQSYRSERDGVMHACGHDGHMAILLQVATILCQQRASLRGTVRFIFQPAEEGGGGARFMIRGGALEGVRQIFGLHLWNGMNVGTVGVVPDGGPITANSDRFYVTVTGRGGHGSMPHETVDAILVAAQLVVAMQSVVSRSADPFAPVVVTVGKIAGGTVANAIAGEARIEGTVRSTKEADRQLVKTRLKAICDGVGAAFGARCLLQYRDGYPATVSTPAESRATLDAARAVVGDKGAGPPTATLAGEDMAYYLQERPGCFFFVGSSPNPLTAEAAATSYNQQRQNQKDEGEGGGGSGGSFPSSPSSGAAVPRIQWDGSWHAVSRRPFGAVIPHHRSDFDIDERALAVGASVFLRVAEHYLLRRPGEETRGGRQEEEEEEEAEEKA